MTVIETNRRMTAEEFLALPNSVGFELVAGQLVERNVSRESSRVAGRIITLFNNASDQAGEPVEVYTSELSYKCFEDDPEMLRRADVSVISKSRLVSIPDDVGTMPIPADLVIEVLSPHDLAARVSRKVRLYLDNGFAKVWIVDPEVRMVAIHTPDAPGKILREEDEIDAGEILPSFRCRVKEFFLKPGS